MSIVIPMYNVERYVGGSIESLMPLTASSFEVILVDDGSTDGTISVAAQACSKLGLERCILLKQQRGGVARARNLGYAAARGDYVLFLDGDDRLAVAFSEHFQEASRSHPDMIMWLFDKIDERGCEIEGARRSQLGSAEHLGFDVVDAVLEGGWPIWLGATTIRRDFLRTWRLHFTPGCSFGEDDEFIYRATCRATSVATVDEVLSHYLIRPGSLTRSFDIKRMDAVLAIRRAAQDIRDLGGAQAEIVADSLSESVVIGHYFFNLRQMIVYRKRVSIGSLLGEIDVVYPGLNGDIRLMLEGSRDVDGDVGWEHLLFLRSPRVFAGFVRARHWLLGSPWGLSLRMLFRRIRHRA